MVRRLLYPFRYYLTLLIIFILEKPLFMLYAGLLTGNSFSFRNVLQVMWHGIPVDLSVAGYLVIFPILVILASIWISRFRYRPVLKVYNFIVALLLALIFAGDAAVYPFWGFKLDASVFFYLESPKDALASVSFWYILAGLAVVAGLTWLFAWLLDRTIPEEESHALLNRGWGTALLVVLLGPVFLLIRGGVSESVMNIGRAYFSTDQFLNHSAVNPAFSLLDTLGEGDFDSMFNFYEDDAQLAETFDSLFPEKKPFEATQSVLKTQRPNILLVIMEGFGADFVESLGGLPDVAPNLQRIAQDGIFFTQCYAGSFRTDRGTVCILNGHPGLPTESIMKLPAKSKTLPSMPAILASEGYKTEFLYGGDINFTNMQSYLWAGGYSAVYSDRDFSAEERRSGAWGVQDGIGFNRLYDMLQDGTEGHRFTTYLTLSSHEPFEVPYSRLEDKVANSFAYTDSCLGSFTDRLRETAVWDSLLMILVPDHGFCYGPGNKHLLHAHHIPMIWTGGAVESAMTVDRLVDQYDLAASVLAQMGLDHSSFRFSRDIFAVEPAEPFVFYSFKNGFAFIDETGTSLYDNDADRPFGEDGPGADARLSRGKAILQTLYDDLARR